MSRPSETTPLLRRPKEPLPSLPLTNLPNAIAKKKAKKVKKKLPKKAKLSTFNGVFLPTSLNVLSILMFLRFGFIIGQMGIIGTMFLLVLSYSINILTTLSISAISTNGTVKGGGAYYMISRSLGPEFGVAIGIIFFIGQILNSSLNVVGFIEPLLVNFGLHEQVDIYPLLPVGYFWLLLYSTVLLAICTMIALIGSSLVSKTALLLFIVLSLSTLSIPVSSIFVRYTADGINYTGLTYRTMVDNLWPHFTANAVGSMQPKDIPENFRNLFGIFFPATAGIFAGASMSGELKTPSKSIPKGTLSGLLVTFFLYSLVIISMGSSIPRSILHTDIKVIQSVNISSIIIIAGEFSTSLFSVIMGIVGAASMLTAIADDKIIPGLTIFTSKYKYSNIYAIILTWLITQSFLFADINQIATFITMAFLMTFIVMNIATFLLKLGSAPNFRPSFKYFSSKTAALGALSCFIAMFIVDGISASLIICFLMFLIILIHYLAPPLKFGDISQLLIYHQVRKYLLRLKLTVSVNYWRPQILLLVDDPRSSWNLIGFCNHLKKGGLYILGHVILMNEDNVPTTLEVFNEIQKQRLSWAKLRDVTKIKAFVQLALGADLPWGVRNVYLGSGLGGMRPNITVIGFHDFKKHAVQSHPKFGNLPTDNCRQEAKVSIRHWVQIVEDLIILQATVAVAANFNSLELPTSAKSSWFKEDIPLGKKKYIDLYPIQMSLVNQLENGKSILSTNFDTYTLILQLGAILRTVPEWKLSGHVMRIIVFVETSPEIEDESTRLTDLLSSLRIATEIKVVALEDELLNTYNFLVKGFAKNMKTKGEFDKIDKILKGDQWWKNLYSAREKLKEIENHKAKRVHKINTPKPSYDFSPLNLTSTSPNPVIEGQNFLNRRYTISNLHNQGLSLSMNMSSHAGTNQFFKYDDEAISSDSSDSDKEYTSDASTRTDTASKTPSLRTPSLRQSVNSSSVDLVKKNLGSLSNFRMRDQSLDQISIRSSKVNLRPNFSSVKIPQSQVNDDDDDDDDNDDDEEEDNEDVVKPSIQFVIDKNDGDDEEDEEDEDDFEEDEVDDVPEIKIQEPGLNPQIVPQTLSTSHSTQSTPSAPKKTLLTKRPDLGPKAHSIITNDGEIILHMMSPQFNAIDDNDDGLNHIPKLDDDDPLSGKAPSEASSIHKPAEEKSVTHKQLQEELKNLNFNDIPAKGQHMILNELMKKYSSENTSVILSTLPAPSIGTHLDEDDALEYTNNLAVWLDGLPPILLINSQTITVTTSL